MKKQIIISVKNESTSVQSRPNNKVPVGLSACLAGHTVRYNGGHSQSLLCLKKLNEFFHYDTFCPEVSAGFGTPRASMRLINDPKNPTLAFTKASSTNGANQDLTQQLVNGFYHKLAAMEDLDGYILMKNSPSCGLTRIKVYQDNGHPHQQRGQGLFAAALIEKYPLLPVEEEGRLHDAALFENFILRVYAHHNFRKEVLDNPSLHKLIRFHSSYKYVLMAHNYSYYRKLGKRIASTTKQSLNENINGYFEEFMMALSKPASKKNHSNTLLHILGYLKRSVPSSARQNIVDIIHKYRLGQLPLVTPLILLKHYIAQCGSEYIRMQRYLQPYPEKLGLANHL